MSTENTEIQYTEGASAPAIGEAKASPLQPGIPKSLTEDTSKNKKKDPEAFKKLFDRVGKINVKPFVDPQKENMGLEKYGMILFPGVHHEEQLAAIERHGVVQFITGLNEFSAEVQNLRIPEEKAAVIHNIRSVVAYLEKTLATNVLDVDDADFWDKVKLVRPDNFEFWGKISLRCSNDPLILEPGKDPYDLIKFMAIEAGGFALVGKSYEDAVSQAVAPKFYLDKEIETISNRTSFKKLRNQAIGQLDKMSTGNSKKLLYVTKVIDTNSLSYKLHTPIDILYDVMDDYINGHGIEPNKTKASKQFSEVASYDMETLKLKAIVKDAGYYRIVDTKGDGMVYHTKTSTMLGRNVADVVEYLKNPLYDDMLGDIMSHVEKYWKE